MKIGYLFQSSGIEFGEPGAVQLHIVHTVRSLTNRGHQLALVANQEGRRVLRSEHPAEPVPPRSQSSLSLRFSGARSFKFVESGLRRLQAEADLPYLGLFDSLRMYEASLVALSGFDIIHERYNLLSMGGMLASKRLGIPYVLEVNADLLEQRRFKGRPERGMRRRYAEWTTQACFDHAAAVICMSSGLRSHLIRRWKINPRKAFALPCAADVDAFAADFDVGGLRGELGLHEAPVVMWIGGFYPWHDLELLVASFRRLVEEKPSARLVLVGDGDTRGHLEQLVEMQGLNGAVKFVGRIPHEEIPRWLSMADITVSPSVGISEADGGTGIPLKVFEYMAAGKPIIATRSSQVQEVLTDGHDSLLVQSGDEAGLAGAMRYLIENPTERRRLGNTARQRARESHSWEHYGRELESIYARILDGSETRVGDNE